MLKNSFFIFMFCFMFLAANAQQSKVNKLWKKGSKLIQDEKYEHYVRSQNAARAMLYFDEALHYQPNHIPSMIGKVKALYYMSEYSSAVAVCNKVLEIDSVNAEAYSWKGISLGLSNRPDEAELSLKQAIRLNPSVSLYYYNLGTIYDNEGRNEEALKAYSLAVTLDPKDVTVYLNRTVVEMNLKLYKEALKDAEKTTQLAPKFRKGWNNLGLSYYFLKEYGTAVKHLEHAKDMFPTNNYSWTSYTYTLNNLANAYHALGNDEKACQNWHDALALGYQYMPEWKELYGLDDPEELMKLYCK